MKPNVLVLLLLTITPVICNLLASETAEKSDATPALSSDRSAKAAPASAKDAPPASVTVASAPAPAASTTAATPSTSSRSGTGSLKGWYMLW